MEIDDRIARNLIQFLQPEMQRAMAVAEAMRVLEDGLRLVPEVSSQDTNAGV